MNLTPQSELEMYEMLLTVHLEAMLRALREMKHEDWDWTPHQAAPSARTSAIHAWQWLMCDRQHICREDASTHVDVEEPPEDDESFCLAFGQEIDNWRQLLRSLRPEDLSQVRNQFGIPSSAMNVRFYIGHMVQNVIYKHGQLAEVFYALGYDGTGPYTAPFPNSIYAEVRAKGAENM